MNNRISPESQIYNPDIFETPSGEMLAIRFDVQRLLESKIGPDWQEAACKAILAGELIVRTGDHHTVREPIGKFGLISLDGAKFAEAIPGIWDLYRAEFKQMMQDALPADVEPLNAYDDPRLALEPVIQPVANPSSDVRNRYEAHVDQRYTGVLSLDAPNSKEKGGLLVISNNPNANSIAAIDADPTLIEHRPGTLLCFSSGRIYPHYTQEVTDPESRRATVSLNYPVEGETLEAAQELLDHAYGKQGE